MTALGTLALAGPAQAERSYETQITGLTNPWGVALDTSENVWISQPENGNGKIVEHGPFPSQTQIGEQTGGGHYGATYIRSLGVDNVNGHLYVADSGPETVDVFDPNNFVEQWSISGSYVYLAVDNSGTSSNGRVYVIKANGGVVAFEPDHTPVNFTATGGYISGNRITGTPGGEFGRGWNISVDNAGNIYVVDEGKRVVDEFHSSGEFVRSFDGTGAPGGFVGELTGVAVDPTNSDVLVVDNGNHTVDEFSETGEYLGQITGPPGEEFGTLHGGIAVNQNGDVYVADGSHNVVDIFSPNILLPKVTYGAVTSQTQTSGTVHASVDLNEGPNVTACKIEYGTSTSYGSSVPCSPAPPYSTSPTAISAGLSGLTTETTYHYRAVLTTANGIKKAADQTFLPHAVAGLTTEPATEVARNTAKLNATFNGNGEDTHYFFEWGTSTAYGNKTAVPPGTEAGSPTIPTDLSFELTGLQVETVYHYRVVASNLAGTSTGEDQSFKTVAAVAETTTGSPTEITATTAILNGSYTGNGEETHFYFEWGPDSSYGHTTAAPPGTLDGSPTGHRDVSFELTGLAKNAGYHYRLVADNATGTTYGTDHNFTTLGAYELSGEFGSAGAGDGQLQGPKDVAVDAGSGDLYVADTGNNRIVKLDPNGNFLAAWGEGVDSGAAMPQVCTSGCQTGIAGSGPGEFSSPAFIEVDNSGGPSAGDVYVADGESGIVQKLDPNGNVISSWGEGGILDFSSGGAVGGITVDDVGDLLVATTQAPFYVTTVAQDGASSTRFGTTEYQINPLGTGLDVNSAGTIYEPASNGGGGVSFLSQDHKQESNFTFTEGTIVSGLAVDRASNIVFVSQGSRIVIFEPTTSCSLFTGCPQAGTLGAGQLTSPVGLAVQRGTGMVFAADSGSSKIVRFSPLPVPSVTTGAAERGMTSATLSGHVDPGSGTVTECYFQYGTDTGYSLGIVPCDPAAPFSSPTDVSAEITGLTPFTTYHYRLVAIRADGKGLPADGRDQSVTAGPTQLPAVDGTSASGVTETAATLHAQINPNLGPTVYRFEYGPNTSYGIRTTTSESIGEDAVDHTVSATVGELNPGAIYHFRVLAINVNGTTTGPDMTFETAGGGGGSVVIPQPQQQVAPPVVTPEPPPLKCKAGFVKKGGMCVKRRKHPKHKHTSHGKGGHKHG